MDRSISRRIPILRRPYLSNGPSNSGVGIGRIMKSINQLEYL